MLKMVIFDLDGVLVDSIALMKENFIKSYPDAPIEMFFDLHLGNFHEESDKIAHLKREISEEEHERQSAEYAATKRELPFYAGMPELLKELHSQGLLLALNTSGYDNNCLPLLERAGVKECFDFLGTAEVSKSKEEKFKMIKEKYQLPTEEMLFVTDTLGDVKEAHAVSIPTVAVTWGAHNAAYFDNAGYSNLLGVVTTVSELRKFIQDRH